MRILLAMLLSDIDFKNFENERREVDYIWMLISNSTTGDQFSFDPYSYDDFLNDLETCIDRGYLIRVPDAPWELMMTKEGLHYAINIGDKFNGAN